MKFSTVLPHVAAADKATDTHTDKRIRNIFASKQMDKLCCKPVVSWQLLAHVVAQIVSVSICTLFSVFRIQFSVFRSQFTVNSFPFRVFRCCSSSFSVFCFQFKVLANILRLPRPLPSLLPSVVCGHLFGPVIVIYVYVCVCVHVYVLC